jgi:hypothetical protein
MPRAPAEPDIQSLRAYVRGSRLLTVLADFALYANHPSWGP